MEKWRARANSLKCPVPNCDYKPRSNKNDDPNTLEERLCVHLSRDHHKGEVIKAILILAKIKDLEEPK